MSVGKPLKSEFSVPFSFLVFLNVIAIDFQNLLFWGLISPGQAIRVGVPELELEFLIPQGGSVPLLSLPTVTCHGGAFSLVSLCLRLSLSSQCCPFIFCCGGSVRSIFRSLSEGVIPRAVVDCRVHGGRGVRDLATPPS